MDRNSTPQAPLEEALSEASPPLTTEEINRIVQGNLALQKALDQDPTLMTAVETVIGEHIRKGITPRTVQGIYQGLELYLEAASVEHLLRILVGSDDARVIEQARAHAAPQTWNWLRRLLALYGSDLQEAGAMSGVNENAWSVVNRRAYYDAVAGTWGVTLEIIKYNGERLFLEEVPGSALALALAIVDTLNSVPPEVAPDIIDRAAIGEFTQQCVILSDLYAPGMIEEWAEAESEEAEDAWASED